MADTIDFKVDDKKLQQAMVRFAVAKKKSYQETLIQASRILAENLSFQTQPFSHDKSAKESGEGAVGVDISRVYKAPGFAYFYIKESGLSKGRMKGFASAEHAAKVFVMMIKKGFYNRAEAILQNLQIHPFFSTEVGKFDLGHLHEKARHGGRQRVSRNQFPALVVSNVAKLKSYILAVQKRVGMAKAGWASCSQQLGGFGKIPAWVTRHVGGVSLGLVHDASFLDREPFIRMTNKVPWIDKCLSQAQMQRAIDIAAYKIMAFIKISMRKAISSAGL